MSLTFTSSYRCFFPKHPFSITKTLKQSQTLPIYHHLPLFFKPITIQSIPTKPFTLNSTNPSQPDPITHLQEQPITHLPKNLQEIIKLFQSVQDPRAKYEQLLFYGKNLKPLDDKFKVEGNKVKGCVSQVWLRAYFGEGKDVVYFEGDSDSVLTKGLAALLVKGLSGSSVEEILRVSPDFVVHLGLSQSLTPSRNNGFLNMLEMMQKKALRLLVEAENGGMEGSAVEENVESVITEEAVEEVENVESTSEDEKVESENVLGSRGARIMEVLTRELNPIDVEVKDVSYQHAGHAGVRGSDGETHFNLRVVSSEFEGKSMVKRHRLLYSLLDGELQNGLHALSIEAKTPSEVGS